MLTRSSLSGRAWVRCSTVWLLCLCSNFASADGPLSPLPVYSEVLGSSALGKPIVARRWNAGSGNVVLVLGAIHGDERESGELAYALERHWRATPSALQGREVLLVVEVNPDGYARRTRKNANKVDLNRNFPFQWKKSRASSATYGGRAPLSEPEARIMHDLVADESPAVIIALHSCRRCGGVNNYDGPARALADEMRTHNGYAVTGEWPQPTPGSFGRYAGKLRQIPTLTLEMPRGMPSEDMVRNIKAIDAVVARAAR